MPSFETSVYTADPPRLHVPRTTPQQWHSHFGRDSPQLAQSFADWCSSVGVIRDTGTHFERLLDHARATYFRPEQSCLWLEARITHSSELYTVPRPHHDGQFWDLELCKGKDMFKVGACFFGPCTVFWNADEDNKEAHGLVTHILEKKAEREGLDRQGMELRKWATDGLQELGVGTVQPALGQAVRWIVGSRTKAAIHSEPDASDMPDGRIL